MDAVVSPGGQTHDQLYIAAQLVRDYHTWTAELSDQAGQKALCGFGIASRLHQDVECVPIGVHRLPQPVLHAIDRDQDLVQVPLVVWARSIPANTSSKMCAEPVDPKADGFAADDDALLRQQVLDICLAEHKAMVSPDNIGDDRAGKTKALQARHG